ncbi:MAG: hypothetical protein KC729_16700, partial [Candidatus Eisenbacteria bacterium]|nr:hypothetical protein [Candidatus Eisenbacteria bacterium]
MLLVQGVVLLPTRAFASVTWADFVTTLPVPNVPTTISLGGGSTVDVTITGAGTLSATRYGTLGASATGLNYNDLIVLNNNYSGGGGHTAMSMVFSNFSLGLSHRRGYFFVGAVNGSSSPIKIWSSVAGAWPTWTPVGSTFNMPGNTSPISYVVTPTAGEFQTSATIGN